MEFIDRGCDRGMWLGWIRPVRYMALPVLTAICHSRFGTVLLAVVFY
jgi:hypothetical protein